MEKRAAVGWDTRCCDAMLCDAMRCTWRHAHYSRRARSLPASNRRARWLPARGPYIAPPRPSERECTRGPELAALVVCGGWRPLDPAPARQDRPAASSERALERADEAIARIIMRAAGAVVAVQRRATWTGALVGLPGTRPRCRRRPPRLLFFPLRAWAGADYGYGRHDHLAT